MINPKGDGACLPRAISLALYGHEGHHQKLRDLVVDFQEKNAVKPLTASFQRRMNKMRKKETYMETEEVEAFSQLLQTPIYSCVQQPGSRNKFAWQRCPHETAADQVVQSRAIYIFNANSHFQLVTQP